MGGDTVAREARAQVRKDGRSRLPPGQEVLRRLKPMGGTPGDPRRRRFKLRIHGEVERPYELDFAELVGMGPELRSLDVHCVTGWSVLGARFKGVTLRALADRAGVKRSARHLILEAAHGYTANVILREALATDNMVAYELDGVPLARPHGSPVRAVLPGLYFWKSPKFITGLRFASRDQPGYWETRGYHNHADPWREERYG